MSYAILLKYSANFVIQYGISVVNSVCTFCLYILYVFMKPVFVGETHSRARMFVQEYNFAQRLFRRLILKYN